MKGAKRYAPIAALLVDVIPNVDGHRVPTVDELNSALGDKHAGEVVSIESYNRALSSTRVVRMRVR